MLKLLITLLTLDMFCCVKPPDGGFALARLLRPPRQSNEVIHFRDDDRDRQPAAAAPLFQNGLNTPPRNDFIVFPGQFRNIISSTTRRTTTVGIPGMGTTRSACEDACRTTNQYNPTCGDDNVTYFNKAKLDCAVRCGKKVSMKFMGRCSSTF